MTEKKKSRIFKSPAKPLDIIANVRLTKEDVDRVNELIDQEHRTASEIIRDAIRQYQTMHS